jgi:glycosyltransferase involved in cell wall biosynthesis
MNILHLSSHYYQGAGIAARRFHQEMLRIGLNSILVVKDGPLDASATFPLYPMRSFRSLTRKVIRVGLRRALFKPRYYAAAGLDLGERGVARIIDQLSLKPDALFLHWVSDLLSCEDISKLWEQFRCPIYWVLTDMAPLTGGCHYSWGCELYAQDCGHCPAARIQATQMRVRRNLKRKAALFEQAPISFIAPNKWVEAQARKSTLRYKSIFRIYLPVNSTVFRQKNVDVSSSNGMPYRILLGAWNLQNERKGVSHSLNALNILKRELESEGKNPANVEVLLPSNVESSLIEKIPFRTRLLSFASDDAELNKIYHQADIFVCTSIEDSGPLMIGESLMSGTPVASFDMGSASDLMEGGGGYVVPVGDDEALAARIREHWSMTPEEKISLSRLARESALGKIGENSFEIGIMGLLESLRSRAAFADYES